MNLDDNAGPQGIVSAFGKGFIIGFIRGECDTVMTWEEFVSRPGTLESADPIIRKLIDHATITGIQPFPHIMDLLEPRKIKSHPRLEVSFVSGRDLREHLLYGHLLSTVS